jgi:flagellar motor switch protein FliN/FliY
MSDDTEAGTLGADKDAAAGAPSATPFDDIDKVSDSGKEDAAGDNASFAGASDLEAVFDVPVKVSAILGRSRMDVADLLKLSQGSVVELDRKVGEAIDIYVNDRLVARGEVVLVEDRLGVTMTEIIQTEN